MSRIAILVVIAVTVAAGARPVYAQADSMEPATVKAGPTQPRFAWIGRFGAEGGGEKVLEFQYEDGSTPDVTSGGGVLFQLGANASLFGGAARGLDARLTAGIKYRTIPPATNQDATWLRYPVEAMLMFRTAPRIAIGGGATYHLNNALSTSGAVADGKVEFRTTPGFLVQGEYRLEQLAFDVRYTKLEYQVAAPSTEKVDASSLGVGISYFFGRR